ncbi:transposase [Salinibacter ruber]|uniref:transposase n=1 Tax=Salinibacter ruber TaxID=146919 RepID=UPI003C6E3258
MSCFRATGECQYCWSRPENQIIRAEITGHLKAEPGEQALGRRGQRNGTYERKLTTRAHAIELEVPRDRDGEFQTALFQRYQRSEKAPVLTLMQTVVQGVSTCRVKDITGPSRIDLRLASRFCCLSSSGRSTCRISALM